MIDDRPATPTSSGSDHPLLASVAAHGLPGARADFPSVPLGPAEWQRLLMGAHEQRILGHLVPLVHEGLLLATENQVAAALNAFRIASFGVLKLEDLLLRTVTTLQDARIPVRVLKGPATAHTLFADDVAQRGFIDIDLLVAGERLEEAVDAITAMGGRRTHYEPRRDFDRRFSKAITFEMAAETSVDLHRTLAAGPYGFTVDVDDLFVGHTAFRLGGRELLGLERHRAFLHACLHAILGDRVPRLVPLRDVAQYLVAGELDLDEVVRRAEAWRVEAVVARAVVTAEEVLSPNRRLPLSEWARAYEPRWWEPRVLDAYVGEHRSYARQLLTALPFVPGVFPKVHFVRSLAFPETSYVERRDGSYLRRWRRALDIVVNRA